MKLNTMMTAMLLLPSAGAMAMSGTPDALPDQGTVNKTVRFIAVGDTGTGEDGQYKVAAAMQALCEQKGCDFALGLGDNVYESGVDDVDDLQFVTKFEQPYAALNMPFYMTLGNHDNSWLFGGDGLDNDRGEIQVDYHYHTDRQSDKWHMPARYYTFNAPLADEEPLINFISVDSNPLAAVADADADYWQLPYKKKQAEWLDNVMETSTAPWKIVFAHHPFISNGKHGNAGIYDGVPGAGIAYFDLLREHVCNRAQVIITGHDHDMQVLNATDNCGKTRQIVSGAGAKTRSLQDEERNAADWQQGDILGFFHIEVNGDAMTVTAITVDPQSGEHQEAFSTVINR